MKKTLTKTTKKKTLDWRKVKKTAVRGTLAVTQTFTESVLYDTLGILSSEEIVRRINSGEAWIKTYPTEVPGIDEIWTEIDGKNVKVAQYAEGIDRWEEEPEASDPE